jgi:hypothetical protein
LGHVYNALPANQLKDEFEKWAKEEYRDSWARLAKKGRRTQLDGRTRFKIERLLEA